jgi:hypothetical protein
MFKQYAPLAPAAQYVLAASMGPVYTLEHGVFEKNMLSSHSPSGQVPKHVVTVPIG